MKMKEEEINELIEWIKEHIPPEMYPYFIAMTWSVSNLTLQGCKDLLLEICDKKIKNYLKKHEND